MIALNELQQQAFDGACYDDGDRYVIKGAAGTGKTVVLSEIAKTTGALVVTPTNKAAKVLQSKGVEAMTLHKAFFVPNVCPLSGRLLGFTPKDEKDEDFEGYENVLVDESSMVGLHMVAPITRMSRRVVWCGDHNQLPPVKAIDFFGPVPADVILVEQMRSGDRILALSQQVLQCRDVRSLDLSGFGISGTVPKAGLEKIMFVAWRIPTVRSITKLIRRALGRPADIPVAGETMLVTAPTEDTAFTNGDQIEVESFIYKPGDKWAVVTVREGATYRVNMAWGCNARREDDPPSPYERDNFNDVSHFSPINLQFAVCLTAHKAQGSESSSVIVVDERFAMGYVSGMDSKRWFYTAVTRAQKQLGIGSVAAVKAFIERAS